MFCTNCGRELSDDIGFCPECGEPIKRKPSPKEKFCIKCGKDLKGYEESKFCPYCGGAVGGQGSDNTLDFHGITGINNKDHIPKQISSGNDFRRWVLIATTVFSALGLFLPFIYFYVSAFGYGQNSQNTFTVIGVYKQISSLESTFSEWGVDVDLGAFKGMIILPIMAFGFSAIMGIVSLYYEFVSKERVKTVFYAMGTAISSAIGVIIVWFESSSLNSQIANEIGEEGAWFGFSASVNMTSLAFFLLVANIITFALGKTSLSAEKESINNQSSDKEAFNKEGLGSNDIVAEINSIGAIEDGLQNNDEFEQDNNADAIVWNTVFEEHTTDTYESIGKNKTNIVVIAIVVLVLVLFIIFSMISVRNRASHSENQVYTESVRNSKEEPYSMG